MIARRCLYLFLAVWSLYTIVSFHVSKKNAVFTTPVQYYGESTKVNASFENVTQQLSSDDNETDPSQHPTRRASRKIVIRRVFAASNMHLPVFFGMIKSNFAIDLHHTFGTHWFNKSLLPGYYNFLFRLKPF